MIYPENSVVNGIVCSTARAPVDALGVNAALALCRLVDFNGTAT
jgi:hypothetical protein